MSDSTFHADLDALVHGESVESNDELTRFVTDLYGEEQNMTMPNALKLRIAIDLGLSQAQEPTSISAPVSRRTLRAAELQRQSSRPWAIGLGFAAAVLLVLTAVLRWGMPLGNDQPDNQFLFATPAAPTVAVSPVATPEWWTVPITAEECETEQSGKLPNAAPEDFDALPERQYNLVGQADLADANAAIVVARQYEACDRPTSMLSDRSAIEAAITGESFSPTIIVMLDRQMDDGIYLSAQLEEQGLTASELLESPAAQPADTGEYQPPRPDLVFTLADGRMIVVTTTSSSSPPGAIGTALSLTFENGVWKIDENIPVCIGECDGVFSRIETIYTDALWLMPISTEECLEQHYLPADISEEDAAAFKSRQYRACETDGEAESMQGTDFRVIEGEDARSLSDEIAAQLRQNGETPGSLQRIAPEAFWNETESVVEIQEESWTAFQPTSVVTLDDGRIAVLESTVITSDGISNSGRTSPVVTTALVWIVDEGTWLLDEEVTVCLGNCDSFWNAGEEVEGPAATPVALTLPETCDLESDFTADFTSHPVMPIGLRPGPGHTSGVSVATVTGKTPLQYLCESAETTNPTADRMEDGQRWLKVRTPDGTEGWIRELDVQPIEPNDPLATPAEPVGWLQPITEVECTVEDHVFVTGESTSDSVPRSYEFAGVADPDTAESAALHVRQLEACGMADASQNDRHLDEGISYLPGGFDTERISYLDGQIANSKLLSDIYLNELGLEPDDVAFWVGRDNPISYGRVQEVQFIPSPEYAVTLDDGRIVVPMLYVTFDDEAESGSRNPPSTFLPAFVLMKHEGEWHIDETLYYCLGDCESTFNSMERAYHDGAWLHPIETRECNLHNVKQEKFPDAYRLAIQSRQYRACELSGEERALQGPDFRVSTGSDAESISGEIGDQLPDSGSVSEYVNRVVNLQPGGADWLSGEPFGMFSPQSVVELDDGRFAILETVISGGEHALKRPVSGEPLIGTALIWAQKGDDWLLVEEVQVCLANCEAFWIEAGIEACEEDALEPQYVTFNNGPINLWPSPGVGEDTIAALEPETQLVWLCESEETSNPTADRMEVGQRWLKVRTEDGTEGWIREIDVQPIEP